MPSDRTLRHLVMAVFFLQPLAFGAWLPRIPDVQQALDLGPAALALALLGLPVGTLLTLPFAGPLAARIGARNTIIWGYLYYGIAICLPALAPDITVLFIALMFAGSSISFVELGLNVMADEVEKRSGRHLMNTAHGFWSLGIMVGSLIGAAWAALGIAPALAIALTALVSAPIGIAVGRALPVNPHPAPAPVPGVGVRRFRLPGWPLLGVCFFVFGITMTEGAIADWSAVFLREMFDAQGSAGIGYTVFALFVAAGRFGGDALKQRFGSVGLARGCGTLALVGILTLYLAPTMPIAYLGFAIIGVGVSVGFPLAVTAAAGIGDRPASANVAVLSFVALCGFLVGPPLIGFVAEVFGLRTGLAMLLPMLVVSLVLAGRLNRTGATAAPAAAPAQ
jgi:MFS family permease